MVESQGPFCCENLKAAKRGDPWLGSSEFLLFTDSWVIGEYEKKPYEFLNTVPVHHLKADVKPGVVLRMASHCQSSSPPAAEWKTDTDRYHKGTPADEVTALASLLLGTRLHCGALLRGFEPNKPPEGHPYYWGDSAWPTLPPKSALILTPPDPTNLTELTPLGDLDRLAPARATALVKAARLYQQALWRAETDPADAWLQFVSAVETASTVWKTANLTPLQELKSGNGELFNYLDARGDKKLLEGAAKILRGKGKSQAKFVDFLIKFLPSAPQARPPEGFRIPWEEAFFRKAFKKIYDHRSRALHDGIGFPLPMTIQPKKMLDQWEGPSERPGGLGTSAYGAIWMGEDCPMFLNVFAYIVRHALLSWWKEDGR